MKKHLIIIPGIGDDHYIYSVGAWFFRLFGFTPHIYVFGWNEADPENYSRKYVDLTNFVGGLDGKKYVLGISAGGTIACSLALLSPTAVERAVTLCSPLTPFRSRVNSLLGVALDRNELLLAENPGAKHKITSLYALADPTVPMRLSRPAGVPAVPLPSVLHILTIVLGLTIYSPIIAMFLKRK